MNKTVIFLLVFIVLILSTTTSEAAYEFERNSGLSTSGNRAGYTQRDRGNTVPVITGLVIGYLLDFIGIIFLALMIYGGFTWMIARGNQAEVDKAKRMIESAIIGLVIVLGAYAITYFVGQALKMTSVNGPD